MQQLHYYSSDKKDWVELISVQSKGWAIIHLHTKYTFGKGRCRQIIKSGKLSQNYSYMVLFIKKNFSLFTNIGHIPWSFMLVKFSSFSASMNPSWLASIILNRNSDSRSVISRLVIFSTACLNSPFKVKCKNGVNLTNWAPSRSFY